MGCGSSNTKEKEEKKHKKDDTKTEPTEQENKNKTSTNNNNKEEANSHQTGPSKARIPTSRRNSVSHHNNNNETENDEYCFTNSSLSSNPFVAPEVPYNHFDEITNDGDDTLSEDHFFTTPTFHTELQSHEVTGATEAAGEYQRYLELKKIRQEREENLRKLNQFDPIRPLDSFNITHRVLLGRCVDRRASELPAILYIYCLELENIHQQKKMLQAAVELQKQMVLNNNNNNVSSPIYVESVKNNSFFGAVNDIQSYLNHTRTDSPTTMNSSSSSQHRLHSNQPNNHNETNNNNNMGSGWSFFPKFLRFSHWYSLCGNPREVVPITFTYQESLVQIIRHLENRYRGELFMNNNNNNNGECMSSPSSPLAVNPRMTDFDKMIQNFDESNNNNNNNNGISIDVAAAINQHLSHYKNKNAPLELFYDSQSIIHNFNERYFDSEIERIYLSEKAKEKNSTSHESFPTTDDSANYYMTNHHTEDLMSTPTTANNNNNNENENSPLDKKKLESIFVHPSVFEEEKFKQVKTINDLQKLNNQEREEFFLACIKRKNLRYDGVKESWAFKLHPSRTIEKYENASQKNRYCSNYEDVEFLVKRGLKPSFGTTVRRWNRVEFINNNIDLMSKAVSLVANCRYVKKDTNNNNNNNMNVSASPKSVDKENETPLPLSSVNSSPNFSNHSYYNSNGNSSFGENLLVSELANASFSDGVYHTEVHHERNEEESDEWKERQQSMVLPREEDVSIKQLIKEHRELVEEKYNTQLFPRAATTSLAMAVPANVFDNNNNNNNDNMGRGESNVASAYPPSSPLAPEPRQDTEVTPESLNNNNNCLISFCVSAYSVSIDPFHWEYNQYTRSPIDVDGNEVGLTKNSSGSSNPNNNNNNNNVNEGAVALNVRKFGEGVITDVMYGGLLVLECNCREAAKSLQSIITNMDWTTPNEGRPNMKSVVKEVKKKLFIFRMEEEIRKKREKKREKKKKSNNNNKSSDTVKSDVCSTVGDDNNNNNNINNNNNFSFRISRRVGGRAMRDDVEFSRIADLLHNTHTDNNNTNNPKDQDSNAAFSHVASMWVPLDTMIAVLRSWGLHLLLNPEFAQPVSAFLTKFSSLSPVLQYSSLSNVSQDTLAHYRRGKESSVYSPLKSNMGSPYGNYNGGTSFSELEDRPVATALPSRRPSASMNAKTGKSEGGDVRKNSEPSVSDLVVHEVNAINTICGGDNLISELTMNELQFFEPQLLRFTPPENNNHNHQPNEALLETAEGTGVPTLSEIKTQNSTTKRITTTYNRFYSSQHSTPRIIHSDEEDNSSESFLSLYDTNETKNNSLIPGSRPPMEKTMAMSEGKRPNAKKETISYNLNHTADPQQHISYEPVQHEEELELLSPPQDSNSVTPIYSKTNITRCHSPCTDEDEKKTENTPPPTKIKKQNKNGEYDSDEDMMEPILLKNNTTVFSYSDHDSSRNRTTVTSSNNSFGKSTHHHVVDNNNNNNNKAPPISATVPYDLSDSMFDTEKKEDENNNVSSANYEQSSEDFTVAARQQPTKTYRGSMVNSSANYNNNNSNTNKKTTPVKLKTHQKLKKETKKKDSHNNSVNTKCGGRDTPPPSEHINQNNNHHHKETEHKSQIEHLSDHDLQQQWDLAFSELNSLKLRLNEMTETRKKMEEEQENKEKELKLLKQHFLPHVNFSELDLLLLYLKTVTTEVYDLPRNCIFLNHRDWLSILYVAATFGHTIKLNNNNNNRNNSNNNNVGSPTRDNEKEIVNFSHNDETIKFIDIDYRLLLSELPKIGIMAGLLYFEDFGRNIEKIHICCDNLMSYKSLPINFSQTNTNTNTANNNNNNTEIITQSSNFFTADTGMYNNHHFTSASPLFVVPATAFMMIFAELIIAIQLNAKTSIKFFELFLKDFPLDNNLNNKKEQKIVYFTKDNDWTNDGASRLGYAFFDVLYHHCDDIQNVLDENNENDENNNNEIIPVSHYHNPYNKCHNHPFFYRFKKIPNNNNKNNKTANVFGLRSFNEESEVLAAEELLLHQNKNTLWANISDYVNYNNARVDTLFEKEKEKEREKKFKTKILKTLGETIVKDNPHSINNWMGDDLVHNETYIRLKR